MSALRPDPVATGGTLSEPLLSTLRATAARVDPDHAEAYADAAPDLWRRAADATLDLLTLCVLYRRGRLEGSEFRRQVAKLLYQVDDSALVASLAWHLEFFSCLSHAGEVTASRPQDALDGSATSEASMAKSEGRRDA